MLRRLYRRHIRQVVDGDTSGVNDFRARLEGIAMVYFLTMYATLFMFLSSQRKSLTCESLERKSKLPNSIYTDGTMMAAVYGSLAISMTIILTVLESMINTNMEEGFLSNFFARGDKRARLEGIMFMALYNMLSTPGSIYEQYKPSYELTLHVLVTDGILLSRVLFMFSSSLIMTITGIQLWHDFKGALEYVKQLADRGIYLGIFLSINWVVKMVLPLLLMQDIDMGEHYDDNRLALSSGLATLAIGVAVPPLVGSIQQDFNPNV